MRKPTRRPLVDNSLFEEAILIAAENSSSFLVFFERSRDRCDASILGEVLALEYSVEEVSFSHYGYLVIARNTVLDKLLVDRILYFIRERDRSLAVHVDSSFQESLLSACGIKFYRYYRVLNSIEDVGFLL